MPIENISRAQSPSRLSASKATQGSTLLDWALILPAILLRISGADLSYGAFALLIVHAARGYTQALQALFLSWLFVSLNNELFPVVANVELLRALILIVAAIRPTLDAIGSRSQRRSGGVTLPLLFFLGLCLANSLFVSNLPMLSFLKTFLFGLMALCVLGLWSRLADARARLESSFMNALTAIAVVSAPLALFGRGFEVNDYGFQGILNQPQGFGILMGLLTTWQLGRMLFHHLFSISQILRLTLFMGLLYMSAARTAMLAFLLGTLGAWLVAWFSRRVDLRRVIANMGRITVLAWGGALLILSLIFFSSILGSLTTAVFKGNEDMSLSENFEGSRGQLVEQSLESFKEQPVFGNGFAVPSIRSQLEIVYDPIFGLPVSAPIEKGVLPVAVLEELGVIGAIFLLWVVFSLLREASRKAAYPMIGLLISALAINFGEAVLFSPSGFGLLVWLAIGMAVTPATRT